MNHISRRKLTIIKGLIVGLAITFLYFNAKAVNIAYRGDIIVTAAIKAQIIVE